jgi:hypothetical protein
MDSEKELTIIMNNHFENYSWNTKDKISLKMERINLKIQKHSQSERSLIMENLNIKVEKLWLEERGKALKERP